jgi:predicted dehydrogenase
MQDTLSPIRWGLVGLGWVTTDFIAPAMVQSPGSRLAACVGSSLTKGQTFAERFGVERVHGDEVSAFTHPDRRRGEPDDTVTILGRLDGDCHAVARATREVASAENNLIVEGAEATLITSALRFAPEHVVRVRDRAGTTEERFPASPAYALEIRAFEGELRGERSLLPDGEDSVRTVAVTQAVLQAIDERCSVAVSALVPEF